MQKVYNIVYELRTKKGYTQEELARKAGVTRQTIIAIEKGNYTPSVALALTLAQILGLSVDRIFSITKHEK